jgi:expansin (peptidoglycan-binding protein)
VRTLVRAPPFAALAAFTVGVACSGSGAVGGSGSPTVNDGGPLDSEAVLGVEAGAKGTNDASTGDDGGGMCVPPPLLSGVGLTQYDQTGLGNCGMAWPQNNLYVAASTSEYDQGPLGPSGACGRCLELTGPAAQKATLLVVDQCPTASNPKCVNGHLDLSPLAYAALVPANFPTGGEVVNGATSTSWRYVACPVSGSIVYHFKEGTNPYWIAVQIRNSRYGIKSIRYKTAAGAWQNADARTDAMAFFVVNGWGDSSISLQVVDEFDRVLEDDNLPIAPNTDAQGHGQFEACP